MHLEYILLLLLSVWSIANALPDCAESYVELATNQQRKVYSPNYEPDHYGYPMQSSCQFNVVAPIYHQIYFSCNISAGNPQESVNCDPGDSLWVQLDGTGRLDNSNARRYCGGYQAISDTSAFNSIAVGYVATRFSGFYECTFTARPNSQCDCGQRRQTRIVSGEKAPTNLYPYYALLIASGSIGGGATIISTKAVLTAAHVFSRIYGVVSPNDILVSVGRDDFRKDVNQDTPYSRNYKVEDIRIHPEYNSRDSLNDIAIIITQQFISFNQGVGIACLPGLNESPILYDNQPIIEMGFGMVEFAGAYAWELKQAYSSIMPNALCKQEYPELTDNDLCTLTPNDRNDTCQGDSGGPIIWPTFRDFIIGVVKEGFYCGVYPGKVQRISPFRPWIAETAGPSNFFCYYKN